VPTPGGPNPFSCSPSICVAACGTCSNNADCCPGTSCAIPQGSTQGICGPCGGPVPEAGIPIYPPDSGTYPPPPPDGGPSCGLYGQVCMTSADCCGGVPCNAGRCMYTVQ
jgi:hypothetical protein